VISHITSMPNITVSIPEEIYQRMKKRSDVCRSQVTRNAILDQLEKLESPAEFHASSGELRKKLADAGVKLDRVSVKKAVSLSGKMRRLEWKRVSSIQAN
jgi:hypothetical protein